MCVCIFIVHRHVLQTLSQLLMLLPGHPPTQLLLNTLADLDLPSEILALQHQEADAAFKDSLGAHVTPNALHNILQRWRQQQQQQQPEAGALGSAAASAVAGQSRSAAMSARQPLRQQLLELAEVLGPEVVCAAVEQAPALLSADPAAVMANLQWLQQQLQLSPVAALLLAEAAGEVLLLPRSMLEARYSNLCYLLQQLLGWRLQQVHTLLCNAPQLLSYESARLSSNWQLVQQLARRRSLWLEEVVAGTSQSLVVAILSAEYRQLQQLRYAAEAREMQGKALVQVLKKDYVSFVLACPGFRVWRGLAPADRQRWSLVEDGSCLVVAASLSTSSQTQGGGGRVVAADARGQPILIQLGDLSPSDRLTTHFG